MTSPFIREQQRLAFVEQRDGLAMAREFAQQGLTVYRRWLNKRNGFGRKSGYGRAYQRELVSSCLVYRCYLRSGL